MDYKILFITSLDLHDVFRDMVLGGNKVLWIP